MTTTRPCFVYRAFDSHGRHIDCLDAWALGQPCPHATRTDVRAS